MLELYHTNMSVCSQKVRLVLAEKNIEWKSHALDLRGGSGDQFKPEYLAINPRAQVPTLVHDGFPIRESTLINEYLEEVWPQPALMPNDARGRYLARLWAKVPDDGLHTACADITYVTSIRNMLREKTPEQLKSQLNGSPDPAKRDRLRQALELGVDAPFIGYAISLYERTLSEMEVALLASPWLAGPQFNIADIALIPYVVRLEMLGMADMWRHRPRVALWIKRMQQRPSYQDAVLKFTNSEQMSAWLLAGTAAWPQLRTRIVA